jgi:hypothetical protein
MPGVHDGNLQRDDALRWRGFAVTVRAPRDFAVTLRPSRCYAVTIRTSGWYAVTVRASRDESAGTEPTFIPGPLTPPQPFTNGDLHQRPR